MAPVEFMRVLRARWWAVAALVLLGTGVAWITTPSKPSSATQVARFRATTVLVKGASATGETAEAANLALASSLVGSSVVMERTSTELGRPTSELATDLTVAVNEKAGTLQISSVDTDPAIAMREADTLAAHLVSFLAERRQQQLEPLIAATNERISTFETRISTQDAQLAPPGSPQADLHRAERDSLIRQLGASYDRLQLLTAQIATAGNELEILSPAAAVQEISPSGFSAPDSRAARAAIGLGVGLLVGLGLLLAFERINPKVRTTAQAEQAFGIPVIAEIPRRPRSLSRHRGVITTFSEPYSAAAESYRALRTALTYMPRTNGADSAVTDRFLGGHVVLVTSAAPSEGKTTVVANLAAVFAEKDDEVVVLSGDARQPTIETVLLGRAAAGAKLAAKEQSDTVFTMIPGVRLALSCDPIANPADIVGYEREIVRRARARSQIVLIDTPPALIANDATELMHSADSVVLVARCGTTSIASARKSAELIARQNVAVVGVVLIDADVAVAGESSYYRNRPRRGALRELRRMDRTTAALVGKPVPDLTPLVPPPNVEIAEAPPAEPAEARVATLEKRIDDGGIWRPKTVIDLNSGEERKAEHAHKGQRGRLPLFRAGDTPGGGAPR